MTTGDSRWCAGGVSNDNDTELPALYDWPASELFAAVSTDQVIDGEHAWPSSEQQQEDGTPDQVLVVGIRVPSVLPMEMPTV